MRHKMDIIQGGGIPNDQLYIKFKDWPDRMDAAAREKTHWSNMLDSGRPSQIEIDLGDRIRTLGMVGKKSRAARIGSKAQTDDVSWQTSGEATQQVDNGEGEDSEGMDEDEEE